MSKAMDEPVGLSCAEAASLLEDRLVEEPLEEADERRLKAHLKDCVACRRLVKWMTALPTCAATLSDAEIRSAYHSATKHRDSTVPWERPWKIGAAAAAAAAVLCAAVWGSLQFQSGPAGEQRTAAHAPFECSPSPTTEPVPGVIMTFCGGQAPSATIENDGELIVSLNRGIVGMRVDPNRPQKRKVAVETPYGEVRVKGTVFTVQVEGDRADVSVFRGLVEFVPKDAKQATLKVPAGRSADLRRGKPGSVSSSGTEALRRILEEKATDATASNRLLDAEPSPYSNRSDAVHGPFPSDAPIHGPGGNASSLPSEPPAGTAHQETASSPKRAVPTIDILIQDAQSCLIEQDWSCAASRYQDILRYHPGRPESTAALISLAKIELRRLNQPMKALDHYRTYQERAPAGPMAEEALFGVAEAYRRLGQTKQEQESLQLFIERHPSSSQIVRARARLSELTQ